MHEMSKLIGELFPAGSGPDGHETRALPAIWESPEEFQAAVTAFQEQSAALVEVAAGGDMEAIKAQFMKVGGTCGDCHDAYRAEDED